MQFLVLFEPEGGLHDFPIFFGLTRGILFESRLVLKEGREDVREKREIVGFDFTPLIGRFPESFIALDGGNKLVRLKACAVDAHPLEERFCIRKRV